MSADSFYNDNHIYSQREILRLNINYIEPSGEQAPIGNTTFIIDFIEQWMLSDCE